ncbi:MAG: copper-binding protein [Thiohalocapsa sp.]|nr:copper-binding protein [Thiohalocapsa sp.]MCF7991529.1 copper-binding protein [Thiohalocapsa sp.]
MKPSIKATLPFALIFAIAGCASVEEPPQGETLLAEAVVATAQGNVVGVDYENRVVKLETPDSPRGWLEVTVSEDVRNLAQVRTGDRITVDYIEAVSVTLFRPGEVEPGVDVNVAAGRAAPGERPAVAAGVETSVTGVIEKIDTANELVGVRIPDSGYRVFKVNNPAIIARLSVGDRVRASVTRAWAVGVNPGPFS